MPTYDYVCTQCGHRLEVVHSVHGHGPSACPNCSGPMRKAFAPPAVVFKGTGWARKDRARPHTAKPEADESSPASETGTGAASAPAETSKVRSSNGRETPTPTTHDAG